MWDNYFWFELITSIVALLSMITILICSMLIIWYDFWYWKIGMTGIFVLLCNNSLYQGVRLYIFKMKYLQ